MKFVIVGFGRVGMRTAQTLQSEGHEVVIVERDHDKIARAESEGFAVVEGDGAEEDVLDATGIEAADAIAALTGDLNTNFAACMVGKHHGCRTVLRIDEDYREEIYEKYAEDVDEIIYPERLGAAGAKTALLGGDFNVLADITEQLSAASVQIPEDSPMIGKRVVEIDLPADARVYAHGRANEAMTIPLPQTEIQADDSVALISHPDSLPAAREQLRGESA
ncbi:trk system potassium uptake protein TrkA [Halorientalis persicus]|jgi:trk system potassium uptake protein TrkA|uniref:Trk system potassium uptake protein TrkA n=2 Tax=Halorientalis TaxID=1073987 RepID=A0A1G7QT45_9EURY|nr:MULTISPECIES: TrkA family potassium uptake protein [Halorientalis]SDG00830.1 trk system potassium uptake protein TrkA [Halorientalis regularis]SEN50741.1 trk system potassium uptake protein TrkA [Halorientalis persicus]